MLPQTDTQVASRHLNLPKLPEKLQQDAAFARWYYDLQRVLQERDAEIERRIKALEEA